MRFDGIETCPVCGLEFNTFDHQFCCPNCGWDSIPDYAPCFDKHDAELIDELTNYGNLRCLFSYNFSNRDEIAHDTFEIFKNADRLQAEGFTLENETSFKNLCTSISKWKIKPDPITIKKHVKPFDDFAPATTNMLDILGEFGTDASSGRKTIKVDADALRNDGHSDSTIVLTILHELIHAAMYVKDTSRLGDYWYYKEEAYANAFALKLLKQSDRQDWFNEACEFVRKQPDGYNAGFRLLGEKISMENFRKEKHNPESVSMESQKAWCEKYL